MSAIKNFEEIVGNAQNELDSKARRIAMTLLESAISAADPRNLIRENIHIQKNKLEIRNFNLDLSHYKRIFVVGGGKASGGMAEALEEELNDRIDSGILNIPKGTARNFKTKNIKLNEAQHPLPDERGLKGVEKMMELLRNADDKTLVIVLLSGGGSALLPSPQDNISLEEKQETTTLLLKCGATIEEINIVRKHISKIKGGRLAVSIYPATTLCLTLSDVVGDSLPSIASGPTVPDPSTFADALKILRYHGIWEKIPRSVRRYINDGFANKNPESPKPGDIRFSKVYNIVLGSNRVALEAVEKKAKKLGLNSLILSSFIEGEARHVGTVFSALGREVITCNRPVSKPGVLLAGGETTVTVVGSGKGGRNQELALSASLRLTDLRSVVVASMGTDGLDGSSDVAGAVVDGSTFRRAKDMGMEPIRFLKNNDSYSFFKALNDTILTGPTGTNVNDIMVVVVL